MSADKVWVRTFKTGYKQVTLKQQPFDPAPCGYDDAEFIRTDLSQAAVTAALKAAQHSLDTAYKDSDHNNATGLGAAVGIVSTLITPAQHDALAAHVAAEVAKARAEDAAKVEALEAEVRGLRDSRNHHEDKASSSKSRVNRLRKRKAALMAALLEIKMCDDLQKAKFVANIAHDGWEDEEIIFNNRAALAQIGAKP